MSVSNRSAALTALMTFATLGLVLFVRQSPSPPSLLAAELGTLVEAGQDHLEPEALADLLLRPDPGILIIDVRPAGEFARTFRLPNSVNLTLFELLGPKGDALLKEHSSRRIVLVSEGMTHPAQAWMVMKPRGLDVLVLEDGLRGFRDRVLTPPSLRSAELGASGYPHWREARAVFLGESPKPKAGATERYATDPTHLERPTVVSTRWTETRRRELVILDTRDKATDFEAGHVPGAVHAPIALFRGMRDGVAEELLDADALASVFGSLGLDAGCEVVVYGAERLHDPTHTLLALMSIGHHPVAVMEGGIDAWRAEGRLLELGKATPTAKLYGALGASAVRRARLADVREASDSGVTPIVDVRPKDAFLGETSGGEKRAGRIPRSRGRPVTEDFAKTEAGTFWRPRGELEAAYSALGLDKDKPVIVSCRTGHQASESWFLLSVLLGYEQVLWYDGSWKEWAGHAELPLESGPVSR